MILPPGWGPIFGPLIYRDPAAAAGSGPLLISGAMPEPEAADGSSPKTLAPNLLDYLADLELAVKEIAKTWKPEDPRYRADIYRQVMMNLSYAYFVFFHADPEHPDWSPLWNPVFLQQPNPDTIYLYAPLRGDLTYRVSGNRGTCHQLLFSTQQGFAGFVESYEEMKDVRTFDDKSFEIGPDGEFEILFSTERPKGHSGNWALITPGTDTMMVRYVMQDWVNERDPQLAIECLDPVPPKKRLTPEEIVERIRKMATFPVNMNRLFFWHQNDQKARVGVNRFELNKLTGFQYYWPAVFEFSPGEALIVETDLPAVRPYWNLQLNDPYFNMVEYVYRLSSINGATGVPSSDGKLRAVVALEDPGVPNWLDSAGYTEGTLWGRWYDCDTTPMPTLKRVPFADICKHLPADTPVVTPEQRAEELRARVRACQRRRRW